MARNLLNMAIFGRQYHEHNLEHLILSCKSLGCAGLLVGNPVQSDLYVIWSPGCELTQLTVDSKHCIALFRMDRVVLQKLQQASTLVHSSGRRARRFRSSTELGLHHCSILDPRRRKLFELNLFDFHDFHRAHHFHYGYAERDTSDILDFIDVFDKLHKI